MTFTYCGETTSLTDAEIVTTIKGIYGELGDGLELVETFRIAAECDLSRHHPGAHASLQADATAWAKWANDGRAAWLRWDQDGREIMWPSGVIDCYQREDGTVGSDGDDGDCCLLFSGHPGEHCFPPAGPDGLPSWCRPKGGETP